MKTIDATQTFKFRLSDLYLLDLGRWNKSFMLVIYKEETPGVTNCVENITKIIQERSQRNSDTIQGIRIHPVCYASECVILVSDKEPLLYEIMYSIFCYGKEINEQLIFPFENQDFRIVARENQWTDYIPQIVSFLIFNLFQTRSKTSSLGQLIFNKRIYLNLKNILVGELNE
jgi:hypothetical protein